MFPTMEAWRASDCGLRVEDSQSVVFPGAPIVLQELWLLLVGARVYYCWKSEIGQHRLAIGIQNWSR